MRRAGRGGDHQDAPVRAQPLGIPERFHDRLLDGSAAGIDVNDLLFAVDLVITDYSSIVFEYWTLGRPMLFFAYDLDEYVATRDFYVPFETFVPGPDRADFPTSSTPSGARSTRRKVPAFAAAISRTSTRGPPTASSTS